MAVRTISVKLTADIAKYVAEMKAAGVATDDVKGHLVDLQTRAPGVGKSFDAMSKSVVDFERVVKSNLRDGETAFQSLTRRSGELRTEIDRLRSGFSKTGEVGLFAQLKNAEHDLRTVNGLLKDMGQVAEVAGKQAGANLAKGITDGASKLPTSLGELFTTPVGLAIVGALTPVIVSAISAAITAGAGLGVIGLGAVIESKNPLIQKAFGTLKDDAVSVFQSAAEPLQQPFLDALDSLDKFVEKEKPQLTQMFTAASPAVSLITGGVEHLAADLLPELTNLAGEFADELKDPDVKSALKAAEAGFINIFHTIGDNPQLIEQGFENVAAALTTVEDILSEINAVVGPIVTALNTIEDFASAGNFDNLPGRAKAQGVSPADEKFLDALRGPEADKARAALGDIKAKSDAAAASVTAAGNAAQGSSGFWGNLSKQISGLSTNYQGMIGVLNQTATTADTVAGAISDKVFSALLGADEQTLHWNEAMTNLTSTLKANKNALNIHSAAGQQDREAILGVVQQNIAAYDSFIAAGGSAKDAAAKYDANTAALERQLRKAGLTQKQIDGLIGKYKKVPDKVDTTIAIQGLTKAITDLATLLRQINGIPDVVATTVVTHYKTTGRPATERRPNRWGGLYEHAADGLLNEASLYSSANPGRYMIAEPQTGGEAFIPKHGDFGRSMAIWSYVGRNWLGMGGGGAGGGPPQQVNITVSAADPTGNALIGLLQFHIDNRGGNPQRVLTSRGSR